MTGAERRREREREKRRPRRRPGKLRQQKRVSSSPTMTDASPAQITACRCSDEEDPEAPYRMLRLARSVVLASLVPFLLLFPGNLFAFADIATDATAYVRTNMTAAAVSFAILCLSWAGAISASAAINTGGRLTPVGLLSRMGRLWKKTSIGRLYSTVLLLGYALYLILVLAVVLLSCGRRLGWELLTPLLCLLTLVLRFYAGVVGSVGAGGILQLDEGRGGVEALWEVVLALDEKLLGFLAFFLSHAFICVLLSWSGLWNSGPVTVNAVWMLGAGGVFGYVGVLLRI